MPREGLTLRCADCKMENYITKKNKKAKPEKIEVKKHCHKCNKHTLHREKK
ncbi:50S ribosomal protein L33 [Mycoplasma flocculare]|uniref:Large ribosomal subunit protein bL33 n=2 Tax=Mesomycoplasma flocculare TaxID=2128 RepID=A0A0A8E965_MESFC|nr:50S ribosomal protein L33 [Mesomycoplasma flocculare]MXR39194.1 50S ribosomal protein L33 [Mycoplasma sp. MF12]AJC50127.1 50S ribosomal protein L33 [Mesomycoplasma flocculare ATCC 27399]ENX51278.1 50S ribosomal protein L33 [Mesomycoplasma flocculare ATCC 27716]MXR06065.1 50S ribosomal protein L33 [Mesomycoplasma flocculare]MXR12203.1 50S ribosomal protein L33 [Mesomycoplasma flocculare]